MYKTMRENANREIGGKRERRNEVVKRGLYVIAVDSFAEGNAIVYAMKKIRYLRSKLPSFVDHKSSVDIIAGM